MPNIYVIYDPQRKLAWYTSDKDLAMRKHKSIPEALLYRYHDLVAIRRDYPNAQVVES